MGESRAIAWKADSLAEDRADECEADGLAEALRETTDGAEY